MAQFFGKVMSWIVNEAVVKALANNKTFQRFALKTDTFARQNIAKVEDTLKTTLKQGESVASTGKFPSTLESLKGEVETVKSEIEKFQREGNLEKVAELTYGKLPELELKLKEEAEGFNVSKYTKKLKDHLFYEPPKSAKQ